MSRMGALRGSAALLALDLSQAANAAVLSETLCRSAVNGVVAAVARST